MSDDLETKTSILYKKLNIPHFAEAVKEIKKLTDETIYLPDSEQIIRSLGIKLTFELDQAYDDIPTCYRIIYDNSLMFVHFGRNRSNIKQDYDRLIKYLFCDESHRKDAKEVENLESIKYLSPISKVYEIFCRMLNTSLSTFESVYSFDYTNLDLLRRSAKGVIALKNIIETPSKLIEGLYFDYVNLVKKDYMNSNLETLLKNNESKNKHLVEIAAEKTFSRINTIFDKDQLAKFTGLVSLMFSDDETFNAILKEKESYVRKKGNEIDAGLWAGCGEFFYSSLIRFTNPPEELKKLAEKEYKTYKGIELDYLRKIPDGKTVIDLFLDKQISQINDYLNFVAADLSNADFYAQDEVIGIFESAYEFGWVNVLKENITVLKSSKNHFNELMGDKKGHLFHLLLDEDFKKYFFKKMIPELNLEKLNQLKVLDADCFKKVYVSSHVNNDNLEKIVALAEHKKIEFDMTHETMVLLSKIEIKNPEKIHYFLNNVELLKKIQKFNLAPYYVEGCSNLEQAVDWFYSADKLELETIVSEYCKSERYCYGFKDYNLVKKIAALVDKDKDFCDKFLISYTGLDLVSYNRLIDLLLKVDKPKKLMKKKEIVALVDYSISNKSDEDFEKFENDVIEINDYGDFEKLLDIYGKSWNQGKRISDASGKPVSELYQKLCDVNKEHLLEDLVELRSEKLIGCALFDFVVESLKDGQYVISKFVIDSLCEGISDKELYSIFSICDGKDELFGYLGEVDLPKKSSEVVSSVPEKYTPQRYEILDKLRSSPNFKVKREEIKSVFRQYDGAITLQMEKIADKYNFSISKSGGKHHMLSFSDSKYDIAVSSTPNKNGRAGKHLSKDIINALLNIYCDKIMKE